MLAFVSQHEKFISKLGLSKFGLNQTKHRVQAAPFSFTNLLLEISS